MWAFFGGYGEDFKVIIKVLLEAGAEVNTKDKKGNTPLMWAADCDENPEVIKIC